MDQPQLPGSHKTLAEEHTSVEESEAEVTGPSWGAGIGHSFVVFRSETPRGIGEATLDPGGRRVTGAHGEQWVMEAPDESARMCMADEPQLDRGSLGSSLEHLAARRQSGLRCPVLEL